MSLRYFFTKLIMESITPLRKIVQLHAYTTIQMHETIARKAGIPGTDHKYLGYLIEKGQMTAGELAELTGLTTGAVTGLIDRMEKKKLVKRDYDKEDRRKVYIVPDTKKIMALMAPLYKNYRTRSEKLLNTFSKKEAAIIERYLQQAVNIMHETIDQLKS